MPSRGRIASFGVAFGLCGAFGCGFSPSTAADASVDAQRFDAGIDAASMALRACPVESALLACFLFDGNTVDGAALNNPNVSRVGFVQGKVGEAASFTTSSQLSIEMPELTSDTALTIEAWVRKDRTTLRSIIIDKDGEFAVFILDDGRLACQGGGGVTTETATATISETELTHIACAFDGTEGWTAYIDGSVEGLPAGPGILPAFSTAAEIGGDAAYDPEDLSLRFTGVIDNRLIWSSTRSQAQICATAGLDC